MGLHLINSSRLIKDVTLRHYLKKLYPDNTFDVRENKTSIIINEVDDKVVVGIIKETLLFTDNGP